LTSTIYRDHFYIDKDNKVADILEASNFFNETHNIVNKKTGISEKIKNIIIEYEVIDFNECSGCMHIPLLAADRPDTWKTICQNCKIRHKNNKEKTPCQCAKEYVANITGNISCASSKEILSINLPENCICREKDDDQYKLQPEKLQKIQYCY
jgi:hypothetical protein